MPGCHLRVGPDLLIPFGGATTSLSLAFPADPALAGLVFHEQALLFDTNANQLGLVLSQAYTAVVGG